MTDQLAAKPKARHPRGIFERPQGSGLWWVRYADAGGRERREKAGTKGMALTLYRKRKTEAAQGRKLPETLRQRPVSFAEIADAGLEWSRAHKASWRQDVSRLQLLKTALGHRPAAEITPRELEQALRRFMDEHVWRPATFNRIKNLVSMCYRLAVGNGQVNANPARLVRQLRADNGRVRFLGREEEAKLREVIASDCPQHMAEFDLALHTGMRAGEQYGLAWDRVDFERRQLAIYRTKNAHARYLPLNQAAYDALVALRRDSDGIGPVIRNAVTPGRYHAKPRASARNWFEHAIKRAGIAEFTWHCLRHTFASRLIMAGVDIRTVAELLGHRTLAMTMRYAHLAPEHNRSAVERLMAPQAAIGSTPTGTTTGTGALERSAGSGQVVAVQ